MQIWRDEPDSDCAWADPSSCRWFGVGEPGGQSWAVPEAVAVKLMQMGAAAQLEQLQVPAGNKVVFRDIDPIAVLKKATEQ